jgi:hypothetical protein
MRPNCRCSIDTSCTPRNKRTPHAKRDQASAGVPLLRQAQRHGSSTTARLFRVAESGRTDATRPEQNGRYGATSSIWEAMPTRPNDSAERAAVVNLTENSAGTVPR